MSQIENTENTIQIAQNASGVEQMNIVVIGHVDHGKSTVIGRLLADTDSLPEGKLEAIKAQCQRNAKPFEYAFLLDALKDEQSQGITIDSARCFFKSNKRHYIIIDAPGHIEFLKNMISGAARAEAALLIIDAKDGVQENSRRHGYLLSMLGVRQVVVVVNKMDLADYSQDRFDSIQAEYTEFLNKVGVKASGFIPVSAREGDNIVGPSSHTPWYEGYSVLQALDAFAKELSPVDKPLRFPVQDIYKFTASDDARRIVAGRIETGSVKVGDKVVFKPSGKSSTVESVEAFNLPTQEEAIAGQSTGVTLKEQIYIQPGEIMCKEEQTQSWTGTHLKVNIFWMAHQPMVRNKRYKLKLGTAGVPVWLRQVNNVLDASELSSVSNRQQIERHDVAECVLEVLKPIAFDLTQEIAQTGRFVIIDNYEIAGGGVVLDKVVNAQDRVTESVEKRQKNWQRSRITPSLRSSRYNQKSTLVLLTGPTDNGKIALAEALEEKLFNNGRFVYYLGVSNRLIGLEGSSVEAGERDEQLRRLGEVSHLFTDAGVILITTVSDLDRYELDMLRKLNQPNDDLVIQIGESGLGDDQVDLSLEAGADVEAAVEEIERLLANKQYLIEYYL